MLYEKLMPNPLNLGFAIIRDKKFEIKEEDLKRDEVIGALKQGLIEEFQEVKVLKPKSKKRSAKD